MTWLRIVQINDVYKLSHLPHLKTLIDQAHGNSNDDQDEKPDVVLAVLAGDFLAPSLLSSLDKGASMVDVLNRIGITHVCFGNHETDVPMTALKQRIAQSSFCWVNTNMRQVDEAIGTTTTDCDIISVGKDKNNNKQVAILGLLTENPDVYKPGSFGGAKIEPILATAQMYAEKLLRRSSDDKNDATKVDLIIPMTHQDVGNDRIFAEHFGPKGFPLVIGGHDHDSFDETIAGCRILKVGMDATHAAIIDIQWKDNDNENDKPTISVKVCPTTDYPADPDVQKRVHQHLRLLDELEKAKLFPVSDWVAPGATFCTQGNRFGPSTGTSAIVTLLRMGMRAECAIINAGTVRGNKVYGADDYFAWSDLKAELPYPTDMVAHPMLGSVLETIIRYSRQGVRQTPPKEAAEYIHVCHNICYDDETDKIVSIAGKPFDPQRKYLTAVPMDLIKGIDNITPLLQWVKDNNIPTEHVEYAVPAKNVIVEVFAALLWLCLGSFEEIDINGDGVLTRDEVTARIVKLFGEDLVADIVVDNIMAVADMDGSGVISPLEMMVVRFVATDITDHVCTNDELRALRNTVIKVLGKNATHEQIKTMMYEVRNSVDTTGDGKVSRLEVMNSLGPVQML